MLARRLMLRLVALAAMVARSSGTVRRQAQNPITIGFGMALTGGLAPNGKAALLAMQIWESEINAKGGLLGRPVKLVYYDDQSNPATIPGHLHKAAGRGQGRPGGQRLCHQHDRAGDADHHAAQPHVPQPVRPGGEHRVPLSEILLVHADRRAGAEAELCRGLLRHGDGAEPEAADAGDRRRRCGVPAQRDGWRARAGEAGRTEDRLRQDLSADDHRLHADRPRDPGDQSGSRAGVLLSARHASA